MNFVIPRNSLKLKSNGRIQHPSLSAADNTVLTEYQQFFKSKPTVLKMDFSNSRAAAVFDQIALLNLPENVHTNVSCINLLGPKSSTKPPSSSLSTATTTTSSIREAYLLPLLERHNAGKAIYYEDLESSYQKAKDALCKLVSYSSLCIGYFYFTTFRWTSFIGIHN